MNDKQLFDQFGRMYSAGYELFAEGDLGNEMFVVQSGQIEISRTFRDRRTVLALLGPGEFFGEMAIVNDRPRSATARVLEDARLLVIDRKTFEAMLRGRVEIAVRLIKALARRLEQANQQVELLLVRDGDHRVVRCLRQLAEQSSHHLAGGSAVWIPVGMAALAARVGLSASEVGTIVERLESAQLVLSAATAGLEGDGFVVPEVGRLSEFLEFLEVKESAL